MNQRSKSRNRWFKKILLDALTGLTVNVGFKLCAIVQQFLR